MINKRRYCHRGFHGDDIKDCFRSNNIFGVGCLSGKWDETEFNIFGFKDPDYNIIMMSTFSGLTVPDR